MYAPPDPNMYTMQGFQQQKQDPTMQVQHFAGQRFRGTVKTYSENNGYGFIGGDEIHEALGKDVFMHQRDITEVTGIARPQVPPGAVVTCTVTMNAKGQPQAKELQFEEQTCMQMQQAAMNNPQPQPGMMMNTQNGGQPFQYEQNGRRFKGFVRSFSQINGFGFVGSDEITATFGKDAFLHFRELQPLMTTEKPSLPAGTWVTFTVTLNQKGQPQARDIQFEPGQSIPGYSGAPQQGMMPQGQGQPDPMGSQAFNSGQHAVAAMGFNDGGYGVQQQQQQPMQQQPQQGPVYGFSQGPAQVQQQPMNPQMGNQYGNNMGTMGNMGNNMGPGGGGGGGHSVTVSDADAYAQVQADIEKFQREIEAQRAKNQDNRSRNRSRSRSRSHRGVKQE